MATEAPYLPLPVLAGFSGETERPERMGGTEVKVAPGIFATGDEHIRPAELAKCNEDVGAEYVEFVHKGFLLLRPPLWRVNRCKHSTAERPATSEVYPLGDGSQMALKQ
jgi:hypothetical protein